MLLIPHFQDQPNTYDVETVYAYFIPKNPVTFASS